MIVSLDIWSLVPRLLIRLLRSVAFVDRFLEQLLKTWSLRNWWHAHEWILKVVVDSFFDLLFRRKKFFNDRFEFSNFPSRRYQRDLFMWNKNYYFRFKNVITMAVVLSRNWELSLIRCHQFNEFNFVSLLWSFCIPIKILQKAIWLLLRVNSPQLSIIISIKLFATNGGRNGKHLITTHERAMNLVSRQVLRTFFLEMIFLSPADINCFLREFI